MFPSNSNSNNDPISYNDHSSSSSILHRHFPNDIVTTPFSRQEDLPLSCLHFPLSPYNYNHCELVDLEEEGYDFFLHGDHHDLLLHHLQQQTLTTTTAADNNSVSETIINMPDSSKNEEYSTVNCTKDKESHNNAADDQHIIIRKKSSKKDRHSKINTAKGPRDRRMRLSLEVAREFFGLQDMLGYDKASRTVEWLLIQAKPEIKKLGRKSQLSEMNNNHSCCNVAAASKSPSSTSEGEVVSGIDKAASIISKGKPSKKEKKVRQPRKTTFRPIARDLREKARARAKARTKAKSIWSSTQSQRSDEAKLCDIDTSNNNNDLNKFSSRSSFETGKESGTQDHNLSQQAAAPVAEIKHLGSHDCEHIRINGDTSDESLAIMNKWSPNSIFNFLENAGINQEHQLPSFLPFGNHGTPSYYNENM